MTSLLSRTDHKAGRARDRGERESEGDYTRTRERIEREETRDSETRATEITDLPDDNPPWCRAGPHMAEPHDC